MVGYTSQNQTDKFNQFILQFQSDSLDTWHACNAVVVDMQRLLLAHFLLLINMSAVYQVQQVDTKGVI